MRYTTGIMADPANVPTNREELRDELLAVIRARQELSPDHEHYLVEGFLERLDNEIDARIDAKLARKSATNVNVTETLGVVLGVGVPLSAIAVIFAGLPGLLLTWVALTVITVVSVVGSRFRLR